MCFGKFSAPQRPNRKEAYWLLLQNASLTSAWLMPHKQRVVSLWGVQYPSGRPVLCDHSDSNKCRTCYLWLGLKFHSWDANCSEKKSCFFWLYLLFELCYCKGIVAVVQWKHLGSDFGWEPGRICANLSRPSSRRWSRDREKRAVWRCKVGVGCLNTPPVVCVCVYLFFSAQTSISCHLFSSYFAIGLIEILTAHF